MVEHPWECLAVCRADAQKACRAAEALGAGKNLIGLDPSDVSLWLCLRSWLCQISLLSRNQDGGVALEVPGSLQGKGPPDRVGTQTAHLALD